MEHAPARLVLVTPSNIDAAEFAPKLIEALDAGSIAAVILDLASEDVADWRRATEILCPIAQERGTAFQLHNRPELVRELGADGSHMTLGTEALSSAIRMLRPDMIVGAGDCTTRHAAMLLGEITPDYVLLGRLDPEGDIPATHNLVEWWSDLFQLPCVALCAEDWDTVEATVDGGADFIALRDLVWTNRGGIAQAVEKALDIAARLRVEAA
ncbi:thiamine phosphate synthase [Microbaculum marinum]|uniref:Thiamine phosphate synthase n=1 Tax=Microbaculum marinum TaxID=1764581 RepID=A0AAW9RK08_9HYPH